MVGDSLSLAPVKRPPCGVWGLPCEGVGVKNSLPPSKLFWDVPGILPGCPVPPQNHKEYLLHYLKQ